jgi:hypothetical protein
VDAGRAALCDALGTGYAQVRRCEAGTECRAGACRDPDVLVCNPGEPVCIDDGREATCDAEGTGYTGVRSCGQGEVCRDGRCASPDPQSCTPGDSYCDGQGAVVYCPDDGLGYVSYTCSTGYACSVRGEHAGCFKSGSCTPANDWQCDGDVLVRCSGSAREELSNCTNQFGLCLDDPLSDGACCENLLFGERLCCNNATGCTVTPTGGG